MKINKKFLMVIIVIVMALTGILLTLVFTNDENISFLCKYMAIYIAITLPVIFSNRNNIINVKTIYCAVFTMMIGISPILYYFNHMKNVSNNNFIYESTMILLGYFFMILGFIDWRKKVYKKNDINKDKLNYSKTFAMLLLIVSTIAHVLFVLKNRGLLFSGDATQSFSSSSGNGLFITLINLNIFGTGILYNYNLIYNNKYKKILIIFIAINVICYIIRGSRTPIIYLFLYMIILKNAYQKISFKYLIKVCLILLIGTISLGVVRANFNNSKSNFTNTLINELQVGSVNLNYIYNTFPDKTPYQHGKTLLINIEMLKPGPDDDFTVWLKRQIGLNFSGGGVTPTLIGEGYMNFGIYGVLLFSFIAGIIIKIMNNFYLYNKKNIIWTSYFIVKLTDIFRSGFANSEVSIIIAIILIICFEVGYSLYRYKIGKDKI